jgi:hypothetical protein
MAVGGLLKGTVLIDRRAALGSLALGLLVATRSARAQSAAGIPEVGLLRPDTPANPVDRAIVDAFMAGLQEAGYEHGKNVRVELRYAQGKLDRLPIMARELAALPVTAIVTANPYATRAAREATSTIPIVVALDYETDPVSSGWIASIARPGGNLTGLFLDQPEMSGRAYSFSMCGRPGPMRPTTRCTGPGPALLTQAGEHGALDGLGSPKRREISEPVGQHAAARVSLGARSAQPRGVSARMSIGVLPGGSGGRRTRSSKATPVS